MGARSEHTGGPASAPPGPPDRCLAKTISGRPCRARAIPGTDLCALHGPAGVAGRRKGGVMAAERLRRRFLPGNDPAAPLDSSRALVDYLAHLVRAVATGELDSKPAAVVVQACGVLLRALGQVETVSRIEAIERAVAALPVDQADAFAPDLAAVRSAVGDLQ